MKNVVPKFAHLQYQVLYDLDISIAEYFMLDMIYQLSRDGWCNKKLDNIAYDMNITRRGVLKMRDRLIERGLIIKGVANKLRTSEKVNKVYFSDDHFIQNRKKSEQSSEKVNKVHPKSEQSFPKNNNRITKEYRKDLKNEKAVSLSDMFRQLQESKRTL